MKQHKKSTKVHCEGRKLDIQGGSSGKIWFDTRKQSRACVRSLRAQEAMWPLSIDSMRNSRIAPILLLLNLSSSLIHTPM